MSCIKVKRLHPHRLTGVAGVCASIQVKTSRHRLELGHQVCALAQEVVHTLYAYPESKLVFLLAQYSKYLRASLGGWAIGTFNQIYPPQ